MVKASRDAVYLTRLAQRLELAAKALREVADSMAADEIPEVSLETGKAEFYARYLSDEFALMLPGKYAKERIKRLSEIAAEAAGKAKQDEKKKAAKRNKAAGGDEEKEK